MRFRFFGRFKTYVIITFNFQEVDFKIWNFGENGTDPDDYGFRFKAGDIWYDIQVDVLTRGQAMFGHEWEARVIERFCRYHVKIVRCIIKH